MAYEAFQTYCVTVWKIPNSVLQEHRGWIETHSALQPPEGDEWGMYDEQGDFNTDEAHHEERIKRSIHSAKVLGCRLGVLELYRAWRGFDQDE